MIAGSAPSLLSLPKTSSIEAVKSLPSISLSIRMRKDDPCISAAGHLTEILLSAYTPRSMMMFFIFSLVHLAASRKILTTTILIFQKTEDPCVKSVHPKRLGKGCSYGELSSDVTHGASIPGVLRKSGRAWSIAPSLL